MSIKLTLLLNTRQNAGASLLLGILFSVRSFVVLLAGNGLKNWMRWHVRAGERRRKRAHPSGCFRSSPASPTVRLGKASSQWRADRQEGRQGTGQAGRQPGMLLGRQAQIKTGSPVKQGGGCWMNLGKQRNPINSIAVKIPREWIWLKQIQMSTYCWETSTLRLQQPELKSTAYQDTIKNLWVLIKFNSYSLTKWHSKRGRPP